MKPPNQFISSLELFCSSEYDSFELDLKNVQTCLPPGVSLDQVKIKTMKTGLGAYYVKEIPNPFYSKELEEYLTYWTQVRKNAESDLKLAEYHLGMNHV